MSDSMKSGPSGQDRIRSIVIVGGGTAGWMSACLLAHRLQRQQIKITVIESSAIGTVGVGEGTVPAIRDFFRDIELDEALVLRETGGTFKLGVDFRDWLRPGHSFFHPFGLYGARSRGVQFHHYWLKLRKAGHDLPLADYSLCIQMAKAGLFMQPPANPANDLGIFDWAMHFDAARLAKLLRTLASKNGVEHIDDRIIGHTLHPETGNIQSIETEGGLSVAGDLFVDCSGFRALLIGQALGVPYISWNDFLPCDRAVAMPSELAGNEAPCTVSTALPAGWQWTIPLQHRAGNGYVYSSAHISDDEAAATLKSRLKGAALGEPNLIRFNAGCRARFWSRNCVAIGLAAGFLEPLESTSITLIQTGVEKLLDLFPDRNFDPALAAEYNRTTTLEYERIRDFLMLHYAGNQRVGEPLWDHCRTMELPEKLAHKIRLFRSRGKLVRYEWETFLDPSWLSMYAGFGMLPDRYDPMADYFTNDELVSALGRMREAINAALKHAKPHRQALAEMCGS